MMRTQPDWMRQVSIGDVLASGTGTLRIVRRVSHYPDGDLRSVTFAIRRCSWTRRPTTVMGYSDLRLLGYQPVGASMPLRARLDHELAKDIADHRRQSLHCCDVRGIA